jgi:nicotinamidase-related amidase
VGRVVQNFDRRPRAVANRLRSIVRPLPTNAALLVIDVQTGFNDKSWGPRNNPGAEACIADLLGAWRATGRPVVHVRHRSSSPQGSFRPEMPGHAPKPEAQEAPGEPIHHKSVNSAFIGTTLEADLRRAGIDTLVVVGLTTNHCVSTTVRMAGNLGFRAVVVSDATATFDRAGLDGTMRLAQDVHDAALSDLDGEFAEVSGTDEVLEALGHAEAAV